MPQTRPWAALLLLALVVATPCQCAVLAQHEQVPPGVSAAAPPSPAAVLSKDSIVGATAGPHGPHNTSAVDPLAAGMPSGSDAQAGVNSPGRASICASAPGVAAARAGAGGASCGVAPGAPAAPAAAAAAATRARIRAHNEWKNDLVLGAALPPAWRAALPYRAQTWLRNLLLATAICVLPGVAWLAAAWALRAARRGAAGAAPPQALPSRSAIAAQLLASFQAVPAVALLPTAVEAAAEAGWTRAYAQLSGVPPAQYFTYLALYLLGVEYGVYCVHRAMHAVPWLYRNVHCVHHAFNKEHTMSPFAGLAVHALDGVAQALPYALLLAVVPMHYLTYEVLLGVSSLWAANTHDNVHGKVPFVLGARYHTIHHTTYRHNYGQYLVLMDWLHGTLVTPEEFEQKQRSGRRKQS